ncbi:MAG: hypothetical protein J6V72_11040 [Kiritimatiellae bacterium]|nr:hypothetical protein [Kiritimatiellia bacterium]
MSRKSVSASIEAKILEALRGIAPDVRAVGLLETAEQGAAKEEDLTSLQVRVYDFRQPNEATGAFTVTAEVRLTVEQAESANGGLFFDVHEKVALWLERIMVGATCSELDTDEAFVDGLQRTGDDKDFDTTAGTWFAVWNMTLSGRIRNEEDKQ